MPRRTPSSIQTGSLAAAGSMMLIACGCGSAADGVAGYRSRGGFQNGIHLATHVGAYSHPDGPATLRELQRHNVGWIQMVPFAWQLETGKPQLSFRDHTATQTAFIDRVHRNGMRIMMKPHIWSPQFWGENARWRADIRMRTAEDWDRWFEKYEEFILHYARMSERTGVEMFTLGLEYLQATRERPQAWRRLIRKIRAVYSGPLTYAAHYPEETAAIDFWEDLDYIGVVLYPELSRDSDPGLQDLLGGWRPVRDDLHRLSQRFRRPVLIVEVGFNSIAGAAHRPWEWAREGSEPDLDLQARCYEATFRTFWDQPWIGGIYFWKWGIDAADGGRDDIHFTPRGKPAAEVLRAWFGRLDPAATAPLTGAAGAVQP